MTAAATVSSHTYTSLVEYLRDSEDPTRRALLAAVKHHEPVHLHCWVDVHGEIYNQGECRHCPGYGPPQARYRAYWPVIDQTRDMHCHGYDTDCSTCPPGIDDCWTGCAELRAILDALQGRQHHTQLRIPHRAPDQIEGGPVTTPNTSDDPDEPAISSTSSLMVGYTFGQSMVDGIRTALDHGDPNDD